MKIINDIKLLYELYKTFPECLLNPFVTHEPKVNSCFSECISISTIDLPSIVSAGPIFPDRYYNFPPVIYSQDFDRLAAKGYTKIDYSELLELSTFIEIIGKNIKVDSIGLYHRFEGQLCIYSRVASTDQYNAVVQIPYNSDHIIVLRREAEKLKGSEKTKT